MRVLLFGPPGAGKGTQASLLVKKYQLAHISTGNILREVIASGSDMGAIAKSYIDHGKLVPDAMIRTLTEEAIEQAGYNRFILDGYPRTVEQAQWLKLFLDNHEIDLSVIVSLKVPDEVIVSRLSKRRLHKITKENYHLEFNPPPQDIDPDLLTQRPDDRAEAIRKRLAIYHKKTKPVEDFYTDHPNYLRIDGTKSLEEVQEAIGAHMMSEAEAE
ncbi:MAG: adenylate kinase [Bacteroidota bacterium]